MEGDCSPLLAMSRDGASLTGTGSGSWLCCAGRNQGLESLQKWDTLSAIRGDAAARGACVLECLGFCALVSSHVTEPSGDGRQRVCRQLGFALCFSCSEHHGCSLAQLCLAQSTEVCDAAAPTAAALGSLSLLPRAA